MTLLSNLDTVSRLRTPIFLSLSHASSFVSHRNIAQVAEISVSALGFLEEIDKYKKGHLMTEFCFGKA